MFSSNVPSPDIFWLYALLFGPEDGSSRFLGNKKSVNFYRTSDIRGHERLDDKNVTKPRTLASRKNRYTRIMHGSKYSSVGRELLLFISTN